MILQLLIEVFGVLCGLLFLLSARRGCGGHDLVEPQVPPLPSA